jgi:hypothetical protein
MTQLELDLIDHMKRQDLIEAVRARAEHLPGDLLVRLEEQPDDYLRLLLLAARVVHLLRHLRGQS